MKASPVAGLAVVEAAKGVALIAVVAFAVGIGSATAIFTIINGVMLRPLPYPQADRFVMLFGARTTEPGRYSSSTFVDLIEYERKTTSFDVFGWFTLNSSNLELVRRAAVRVWRGRHALTGAQHRRQPAPGSAGSPTTAAW